MTRTLTIGRGGDPAGACTFGRCETSSPQYGPLLWAALAVPVPVAAAERLGLERSPLWAQFTGLAALAAATALHRTSRHDRPGAGTEAGGGEMSESCWRTTRR
ncbi:hypothetical protein ACWGDS_22940 [Streptomyces sp. NPDC055059]|uniref:hypothetical protein n=1 Tax=unclassified Streptomyces TaxID=2593676 RepID=UPI003254AF06